MDDEVRRIVDDALAAVRTLLTTHRGELDDLVDGLLDRETLDEDEAYEAAGIARAKPAHHGLEPALDQ